MEVIQVDDEDVAPIEEAPLANKRKGREKSPFWDLLEITNKVDASNDPMKKNHHPRPSRTSILGFGHHCRFLTVCYVRTLNGSQVETELA